MHCGRSQEDERDDAQPQNRRQQRRAEREAERAAQQAARGARERKKDVRGLHCLVLVACAVHVDCFYNASLYT